MTNDVAAGKKDIEKGYTSQLLVETYSKPKTFFI